ncbi:MAG: 4-hydroxy-3-methylbut-2-enyl diphosphate reductase, partial [Thermodesulfobacteriota bacterium]
MEILIAKSSGFCFGVKRAINMAQECADEKQEEIYTLGPIIHNPQVVKKLERSSIVPREGVGEIEEGTVIIRSHGITLQETEEIDSKGLDMIDATCPFVKKAHEIVSLLCREGYSVIVVGEK